MESQPQNPEFRINPETFTYARFVFIASNCFFYEMIHCNKQDLHAA